MNYFYQPITPFILGQKFGENKACIDIATRSKVIGCDGNNPPEGWTSVYGPSGHGGIDLRASHGQNVYCAQRGVVARIDSNPRTGLDVRIDSFANGRKFRHTYEHLLGYQHKVGDYVETGQVIGWADNTGFSSADHLHFELHEWIDGTMVPVDPMKFMAPIPATKILWINNKLLYVQEKLATIMELMNDKLRRS